MSRSLVGVDPAVGAGSRVGVAEIKDGELVQCFSIRTSGKFGPGERAIVLADVFGMFQWSDYSTITMEGQKYIKGKSSPQSLIALAQAAGAMMGTLITNNPTSKFRIPIPQEVSTLSKETRHKQALFKLGISEEDVTAMVERLKVDKDGLVTNDTAKLDLNDVLDAICLARWGGKQNKKEKR